MGIMNYVLGFKQICSFNLGLSKLTFSNPSRRTEEVLLRKYDGF